MSMTEYALSREITNNMKFFTIFCSLACPGDNLAMTWCLGVYDMKETIKLCFQQKGC